ncbi:MAG: hypothetical protein DWQ02_11385 [Bacteroidetes bacterium]|nr:MAG: hypothetical protein DWQ02_11385 [Bacteroidota bacterium]
MKTIDFKSFVIGLLISFCFFLFISSAQTIQFSKARYEIVNAGQSSTYAYVLDTYTGAVVQISFGTKSVSSKFGEEYIPAEKIREMLEKEH